jgi:hypothetical protein
MKSFAGGAEQQRAFEEIKEYLSMPPVLVPPQQDRPFYVYLSVGDTSIASVVIQVHDNKERVVFYLSRRMLDAETRYPDIEKLCLCLFFTCTKLRHILLSAEVICGRTNLNYTGSSTRVHSRGLQRASNGIIPWPVG